MKTFRSNENMTDLKWTSRLYVLNKITTLVAGILLLLFAQFGKPANPTGILVVAIAGLIMAFVIDYFYTQFKKQVPSSWEFSKWLAGLNMFSVFLPLAYLSLQELHDETKRNRFLFSQTPNVELISKNKGLSKDARKGLVATAVFAVIFIAAKAYFKLNQNASTYKVSSSLSIAQLYELGASCNTKNDMKCAQAVFKRIIELDNSDHTALANLAISLTRAGKHADSLDFYNRYFSAGHRTTDTMAYYARSLRATGKSVEALDWNYKVMNEYPHFVDVAESIVSLLIEQKEIQKAFDFINFFVSKNPSAEKNFKTISDDLKIQLSSF